MAKTEKGKVAGKAPPKPDETPGPETVDAPFDDIIDTILGAPPEVVREALKAKPKSRSRYLKQQK